jgi:hypothetical protein
LSRLGAGFGRWPAWLLAALTLALAFYCVNAVHFGKEPLRIEESEWPPMAKAIYETGKPIIEFDQTHRLRLNEDLTVDESPRIGAWHPPLYLYTLAASMTVLGTHSPYRLRLVGVVGLLASIALLFAIAREVTRRWRLVGGIAAILALVHPFAIQGSVFLDIDPTIYAPLALLVVWLAIRYGRRSEPLGLAQILAIGGAIALVTWAKMTTTIDVLGVLVIWWLLARRPIRLAILEAISFVGVGLGLFFATYGLWCALTDIPFSYTFQVTFIEKGNRLFSNLTYIEHAVHWHLRWLGAAVFLLGVVYLVDMFRNFISARRLRPMDLPFLISAAILVQYVFLSPTDGTYQGKYAFPALLMLLLPISWMLLRNPVPQRPYTQWAIASAIGLLAALLMPDVLTGLAFLNVNYGSWTFELRVMAGVGAALLIVWWLGGQRGFAGGVILVTVALLVAQAVHSYQANTSPMYPIPDTAEFNAAVDDLHQNLHRGDITISVKDLGYYIRGPVIDGEEAFVGGDPRLIRIIRKDPHIVAFARDSFGPPVGPETQALLSECFTDQHVFGTASVVYRTKRCR